MPGQVVYSQLSSAGWGDFLTERTKDAFQSRRTKIARRDGSLLIGRSTGDGNLVSQHSDFLESALYIIC